ncbi:hypothetical protein HLB23_17580 [Nocardia uniformis]|uniref:Uncharacterized protein n=1 Tax=Nocardia uniformis TaxID=53432 RepID=A0A849CEJ1_9NOCA|nr:hypothetical protein [Nocardia uniformis]NNH71651.1 hypothetical protein [Nocardia uniformis]
MSDQPHDAVVRKFPTKIKRPVMPTFEEVMAEIDPAVLPKLPPSKFDKKPEPPAVEQMAKILPFRRREER